MTGRAGGFGLQVRAVAEEHKARQLIDAHPGDRSLFIRRQCLQRRAISLEVAMARDAILCGGNPGLIFAFSFSVAPRALHAGFCVQFVAEGDGLLDGLGAVTLRERQVQRGKQSDQAQ